MAFSANNFLGTFLTTDKVLTIKTSTGLEVADVNVCSIQKTLAEDILLWIVTSGTTISISFSSSTEASVALTMLTAALQSLLPNCAISGGSTPSGLIKKSVDIGHTLTIPPDFQYLVYGTFTNNGTIQNNNELVILGGGPLVNNNIINNDGTITID